MVRGDILRCSWVLSRLRTLDGRDMKGSLNTGPPKLGGDDEDEDGVGARPSRLKPLLLGSPKPMPDIGGLLDKLGRRDVSMIPSMRLKSRSNSGGTTDESVGPAPLFDFFLSRPRTARKAFLLGSMLRKELSPLDDETKAGRNGGGLLVVCASLSSASSLTLLRARLITLSGFMKDLGFLSSL